MKLKTVRLADVCSMKTGKINSNAAVENGQYPFFTCAQETFRINNYAFDTEAVLLGGNNANGVFPLKYYQGKFNAYQRTYVLETLDSSVLFTRYLFYALKPTLNHFQAASIGAATQYLTKGILDNFKIKLPPIFSQNKIINILSSYDDLIENNRRRIELLERSSRLLYREWFVHLRYPGHEHGAIGSDGIPEGWEKVPLGKICFDKRESVHPSDLPADTPYIGLEHMPRCSITLSQWDTSEKVTSQKFKFSENDILFGKIRPYFHKVGFALTDGIASSDTIVIQVHHQHHYCYCLMLVSSDDFVKLASQTMREGSKMPRADWKLLLKTEFLMPPQTILMIFNSYIQPTLNLLRNLAFQNQKLQAARDLLLPRLMNGEINV